MCRQTIRWFGVMLNGGVPTCSRVALPPDAEQNIRRRKTRSRSTPPGPRKPDGPPLSIWHAPPSRPRGVPTAAGAWPRCTRWCCRTRPSSRSTGSPRRPRRPTRRQAASVAAATPRCSGSWPCCPGPPPPGAEVPQYRHVCGFTPNLNPNPEQILFAGNPRLPEYPTQTDSTENDFRSHHTLVPGIIIRVSPGHPSPGFAIISTTAIFCDTFSPAASANATEVITE